jgi:hypothetical protein
MQIRATVRRFGARRVARAALTAALLALTIVAPPLARAASSNTDPAQASPNADTALAFPFDSSDCGPPSTTIPGPPPELIKVGSPMSDSWLMCYIRQDFEGQTFSFDHWGEVRKTAFRGYPVECWTAEAGPGEQGRQTDGIVAQTYGWNLDHTQYVRFTYRIQLDGDYINNCAQEILPNP